jgi:hypothetical protein
MLFTTSICILTGLAVGLAAVRRTGATSVLVVTASESLGAPAIGRWRRRHWILVPQLALSLALLVVAFMAVRALVKVALVPTGYEPRRVAYISFERLVDTLYFSMSTAEKSAHIARVTTFPQRLLEAAEAMPGLEAAAIASALPTRPERGNVFARAALADGARAMHTEHAWVTSAYFRVMGIPVRQGRIFDDRELASGRPVVVVDEALAARLWPGQSAVGQSLAFYELNAEGSVNMARIEWHDVIGVVGAIRGPLSEGEPYAFAYRSWVTRTGFDPVLVGRGSARRGRPCSWSSGRLMKQSGRLKRSVAAVLAGLVLT